MPGDPPGTDSIGDREVCVWCARVWVAVDPLDGSCWVGAR